MSNYLRNVAVLRRIQIARDFSVPPDYWQTADEEPKAEHCPECDCELRYECGCVTCPVCGYSKCGG